MDDLFETIRSSCTPAIWSQGVELARQDTVTGDAERNGEISLRVLARDRGISPTVTLLLDDGDWACTCGGPADPCAHVAAAIIALKRAREQGKPLPKSRSASGKLLYQFRRAPGGLSFERTVEHDGQLTLLTMPLTAITSGRIKGPPVTPTAADMAVEVALGMNRRGLLPAATMPRLLKALGTDLAVTLDDVPILIDPKPVGLILDVRDDGPGVRVTARQEPAIKETFLNGVALCDTGLRPVVLPSLSPSEQQLVREGRFFGRQELGELAATILPALEPRMPLRIESKNLPGRTYASARLAFDLEPRGDELMVTASLVYGDPPCAQVQNGRLIALTGEVPRRDPDSELRLKDQLQRDFGLDLERPRAYSAGEALRLVERLNRGNSRGERLIRGAGMEAFRREGALNVKVEMTAAGGFHLKFTAVAATGGSAAGGQGERSGQVDAQAVMAAWERGDSLVKLTDGGYAPLPMQWLQQYGEQVLSLLAARDDHGKVPRAAWPQLAELGEELGQAVPEALLALRRQLEHFTSVPAAVLPADLTADLRSYQRQGVDWLAYLQSIGFGALLADDMGLGKTLQAIAVMHKGPGSTLVVAPTSVLFNWQAELKRFRPGLTTSLYHGPSRQLDPTADVTITTYALLRLDKDALAKTSWRTIIFDEAQSLKNPDSQISRAARQIPAAFRIALSGTPVENRLSDLWSLMHLLNPGLLGDKRQFQERYARPIENGDPERAAQLRARIRPFLLRRLKSAVAPELPPRTETVLHVDLSPAERQHYDVVRAAARRDVLERLGGGGSILEALEALLRLRQACCHPDLLPGISGQPSAKLDVLAETLESSVANGHKVLVFSQWTSFLDLIEPVLQTANLGYLRLDGSTADRGAIVREFQAEGGPPVLIMSLKAGGVGLNLTAADHVIITDPWWNPAAEDQATDRAHRIGQERPVLVQRLVALNTVEEKILALQGAKRALADAALSGQGGGGGGGAGLSRDDLLALLS